MLRTIIVDDERLNISLLESDIQKYCPELDIIGTADNVTDALELIINKKPDLIFLDIQIHDQTAFDLLNILNDDSLNVILVTAYENYGIKAVKHSVIDYLLKPIQIVELLNAVKKAKNIIQSKSKSIQMPIEKEFLHVHTREHVEMIKLTDIIHLSANGAYTDIHLSGNRKIIASKTLKNIEDLIHSSQFLRVHNSHIINKHYIAKVVKSKYGSVIMINGFDIPISASKRKEVAGSLGLKLNHLDE